MTIDFPDELIYSEGTNAIQVKKTTSSGSVSEISAITTTKYTTNTNWNFVKQINLAGVCTTNCAKGEQISLELYGAMKSPYSSMAQTSKNAVIVSSFEAIVAVIDSGNIPADSFRSNVLSELPTGSFTRSTV